MRHLHAVADAAHHRALFAAVEPEGLAKLKDQGHEGAGADQFALLLALMANEVGQPRGATGIALRCELKVQRTGVPALMLGTVRVNLQGLCECQVPAGFKPASRTNRALRRAIFLSPWTGDKWLSAGCGIRWFLEAHDGLAVAGGHRLLYSI